MTQHNKGGQLTPKSESGQILVIFTVVLVVVLGFTSLAVDVGMIYGDRRYNQSIADTASLAGAGAVSQYLERNGISWANFSCSNNFVITSLTTAFDAARSRAATNLVANLDNNLADKHGIEVICLSDPNHFEKHIDVHTVVTSKVPTTFLHFFYGGEAKNTVEAVVRIHPRTELAFGHALVSLSEDCGTKTGGIDFAGGGGNATSVAIQGGGVFSNSCITAGGNFSVNVSAGGINYFGTVTTNGGATLTPGPVPIPVRMPVPELTPPACGSGTAQKISSGGTISPGNYSEIKLTNGEELTLNPGLYCLTGDVSISGEISGSGVTFYMKKDGSKATNLSITGGGEIHLSAPTEATVSGGAMVGILVFMADGNEGIVKLEGGASSTFTGALYGQDAEIEVGGSAGINPTYNTQLIGKYVKVHGNASIDINYDNRDAYVEKPKLDMID